MYSERDKQTSFFGDIIYEKAIPKDHFLRQLSQAVDFSFVNELCKDLYCEDNGRKCWEPQIVFKEIFLQFTYELSDYDIEDEANDRLSFKWFLGLNTDERAPDHSTLSVFRDRLGAERFAKIFNKIVEIARSKNLVSDKLHIVDSTHIQAKVNIFKLKKNHSKDEPDDYVDRHSPDKDAKFGHKTKNKIFYGYKQHTRMDSESEIIVAQETTPGNESDKKHLADLLPENNSPGIITADKGYDSKENHKLLFKKNIRNGIIPRKHKSTYKFAKRVSIVARKFRVRIEHKYSELKQWHSFNKARYWGLTKMKIQSLMSCVVVNCKRIVKLLYSLTAPPKIALRVVLAK
ncbi:MAG: IS5 family transposase [Elusimicrobia bacterium]|nr:IS5 family transposase [Elusimicrobiota bacterium]